MLLVARIVWIEAKCFLIGGNRFAQLLSLQKNCPEIIMIGGLGWSKQDCLAKGLFRLRDAALVQQNISEVVLPLRIIWIEPHGGQKLAFGFGPPNLTPP